MIKSLMNRVAADGVRCIQQQGTVVGGVGPDGEEEQIPRNAGC